ncbi:MAG: transposase [Alicyclobacillus mali]|uniref:transposase n=1 Tax=Alicyclobacillus mali (ex Roth et al. 2021) TaxID=1123961 RepID=UPI0023F2EDAC|nr:transposase [Alicyclobacillus mali (ex Roth et al. 2021)]MCL6488989.1 transposase [Alicyclobacillus mali (ex Roth et al. 2021)]
MYVRQTWLFSFEEWLEIEPSERRIRFFSALDLSSYAAQLTSPAPQGAKPISREAILRAFLAAPLEGVSTFTKLHQRLESDLRFRDQCGFSLHEPVPSISTLSRVFQTIVDQGIAVKLFGDLVRQCRDLGLVDGEHVAIDSTAVQAYERKRPRSGVQATDQANWGAKFDAFGNKLAWFGYKVHLAVDTKSELPIAVEVTPANVFDGDMAIPLMEKLYQERWKTRFLLMDAGYDQVKNYEAARAFGAQAIIPMNRRREKEPPEGMDFDGTPRCTMGYRMTYWGAESDWLKFRCPHATGHVDCPLGMAACSASNYGMVVKKHVDEDVRRYANPHRGSRTWKMLYDERTAVERCFSRLKEWLTLDGVHVRGIEKVTAHAYINAIVLLASALAMHRTNRIEQVA